jgi:phosphatidylserine/phosphatidylglycerophosphate/cardiolipin synthase-like enzyme/V8-like Glu-specific endopeptidase
MKDPASRKKRKEARDRHNKEFFERLRARRPHAAKADLERAERETVAKLPGGVIGADRPALAFESLRQDDGPRSMMVFETIVFRERPVLFVQHDWLNKVDVTLIGEEAKELVDGLDQHRSRLEPLMPLVGRIDVSHFPGLDYVGTAWLVAPDIVVTNRHVASLVARHDGRKFVFSRGVGAEPISCSVCTAHEFDDLAPEEARIFAVEEVLYIEPDSQPNDIAFLRVRRQTDGTKRPFIPIAQTDVGSDTPVLVVGYPARAPKSVIPDQELMKDLYQDRYDVKRAAPGYTMQSVGKVTRHDCTTLGGNSGSVVIELATGNAVGLHFAGLYQETNLALTASVLADYVNRKRWLTPPVIETSRAPVKRSRDGAASTAITQSAASSPAQLHTDDRSATISIPLSITLTVGGPTAVSAQGSAADGAFAAARQTGIAAVSLSAAEAAAKDFWDQRPAGVIAVRVGFSSEDERIGDVPLIAASVPANLLAEVQAVGPTRFQTLEVRYFAADAAEQIAAFPALESVESIAYDDDARTTAGFSFEPVDEEMSVRAHVGPEFSWDELKAFLAGGETKARLVSAIYEFHAAHIADALEARLDEGAALRLVMDNASFIKVKDADEEFDRVERFEEWERFGAKFERIVAPEGTSGLISDSYHIKVTVRDDDTFWLSSGNWKAGSSQPIITQEERDDAVHTDLPGNREWHVVIENKTLADRFRNHIEQDFARSADLGGGPVPKSLEAADIFVDVPIEEGPILERRAPDRVLEPRTFTGKRKVRPLLTPDSEGEVYSEAVLELIRSARDSLLFQIPYIGMPSKPRDDRGYIDELIKALTQKLKTLRDARLILRVGGSKLSAPTHAAWYFKSKGVDIDSRVRQMEDHHTKGMIVDGKRVLIGSHNWSKPGVTLNRDASLIFDDAEIATYFGEAFEIDWSRANPIKPKKLVKEGVLLEARGDAPPAGYERVLLSELLKEDE